MATKGSFTGTAASAIVVPANKYRDAIFIQKTNATAIALGIGEAAESGKGIQLVNANDAVTIRGAQAKKAIYAIGNNGTGVYAEVDAVYTPGPTP